MKWSYVITGLSLMLVGAYLDNIRGPLLPLFSHLLDIPYHEASLLLVWGNFAAVLGTLALLPLLHRWGPRAVSVALCLLAIGTSLYSVKVGNLATLSTFAILLGVSLATVSGVSNIWMLMGTDGRRRARFLCGLHMMYGFGSLLGPWGMGLLLSKNMSWPTGLLITIPVFIVLIGFILLSGRRSAKAPPAPLPPPTHLNWLQWVIVAVFCLYVAGEVMTSMWMVTFLVEARHMTVSEAAPYLTIFFLVMGLTRGLCFLSLKPALETVVLVGCLILGVVFATLGHFGFLWAFPLVGVLGPFFPLMLARVSRTFPSQSNALTLWILGMDQLMLALLHLSVGKLTDWIGIGLSYFAPPLILIATLAALGSYFQMEKRIAARAG